MNWCTRFCRPLRNHSATWPHGGELIYALPDIGNRGSGQARLRRRRKAAPRSPHRRRRHPAPRLRILHLRHRVPCLSTKRLRLRQRLRLQHRAVPTERPVPTGRSSPRLPRPSRCWLFFSGSSGSAPLRLRSLPVKEPSPFFLCRTLAPIRMSISCALR